MGRGLAVQPGDRNRGLPRYVRCEARSNEKGERGRERRFPFSFQFPRQISVLAETASPFCGVLVSHPSIEELEELSQGSQSRRIPARRGRLYRSRSSLLTGCALKVWSGWCGCYSSPPAVNICSSC